MSSNGVYKRQSLVWVIFTPFLFASVPTCSLGKWPSNVLLSLIIDNMYLEGWGVGHCLFFLAQTLIF